jgi:hypothetical protein
VKKFMCLVVLFGVVVSGVIGQEVNSEVFELAQAITGAEGRNWYAVTDSGLVAWEFSPSEDGVSGDLLMKMKSGDNIFFMETEYVFATKTKLVVNYIEGYAYHNDTKISKAYNEIVSINYIYTAGAMESFNADGIEFLCQATMDRLLNVNTK